jgi:hypothetical protein
MIDCTLYEELCALLEYDANYSRQDAEKLAFEYLKNSQK